MINRQEKDIMKDFGLISPKSFYDEIKKYKGILKEEYSNEPSFSILDDYAKFVEAIIDKCNEDDVDYNFSDDYYTELILFGEFYECRISYRKNEKIPNINIEFGFLSASRKLIENIDNQYVVNHILKDLDILIDYADEFCNSLVYMKNYTNADFINFIDLHDNIANEIIIKTQKTEIVLIRDIMYRPVSLNGYGLVSTARRNHRRINDNNSGIKYVYRIKNEIITNINSRSYDFGVIAKLVKYMKGTQEDITRIKTIEQRLSDYDIPTLKTRLRAYAASHPNYNISMNKIDKYNYRIQIHETTITKNINYGTAIVTSHNKYIYRGSEFDLANLTLFYSYKKSITKKNFYLVREKDKPSTIGNVIVETIKDKESLIESFIIPEASNIIDEQSYIDSLSYTDVLAAMSFALSIPSNSREVYYYRGILLTSSHILNYEEAERYIFSRIFKNIDILSLGRIPRSMITYKMSMDIVKDVKSLISVTKDDKCLEKLVAFYGINRNELLGHITNMVYCNNLKISVLKENISLSFAVKKELLEFSNKEYYKKDKDTFNRIKKIVFSLSNKSYRRSALQFILLRFLELDEINGVKYSVSIDSNGDYRLKVSPNTFIVINKNIEGWIIENDEK